MWLGFVLDLRFAEPKRWHPLVGFGACASALERWLNRRRSLTLRGLIAVTILLLPITLAAAALWWWLLLQFPWLAVAVGGVGVYFALGAQSLAQHIAPVIAALNSNDLPRARAALQKIVSRNCDQLTAPEIARAALESLLENTSDAIIAPLFWFALAGLPGVLLHRFANTLDAMWGYRTHRFAAFGWAAARLDDGLNYIPARLCALAFAACGDGANAVNTWRKYARAWDSPNAGPVITAGAGALGVSVGGGGYYHGRWQQKPTLPGAEPNARDLERALGLAKRASILSLVVLSVLSAGVWR
nr:adenosylcobinamide-phosphate synthase CbiB [Gilvimarinus xylanilyticus]